MKGGHKMKYKKVIFVFFLLFSISLIYLFALAQSVGYIQIKCEPGATVFLDNNFVGNTSSELGGLIIQDVPTGIHEMKIVKEGSEPQSVKIDLKANEIYVYEVSLKQKSGSLLIETLPIDCIIEIPLLNIDKEHNGNKIEKTWEVSDIPIGNYRINFLALGKKVKYDLKIEEGVKKHLLVNILKNEVKEIVPVLTWDRTYGGNDFDAANFLIQTTDGGYTVAGLTRSKGADNLDFWVIKLDEQGNKVWNRTYGGSDRDIVSSFIQITDGGYAVAGSTTSKGAGGWDFWVIKLDKQGNKVWDKTYGGNGNDVASSLIQTTDGGYAVAGSTESVAGYTKSVGAGGDDFWVIKLDKQGNKVWDKTYGGSNSDWASSLIQTTDGGYAVAGSTRSKGAGGDDFWVIKLDKQGNKVWDKTYGGSDRDIVSSFIQTTDDGYAVAGSTESKGAGNQDFWVIKLDKQGNKVWDKTYGGNGNDVANSLIQTTDGGYAVAGLTTSKGAGGDDFWVIKLDEQGNLILGVSKLDYEAETGTESTIPSIQSFKVPTFNSYKWEVGILGFAKPGEITKFKDTTISTVQLSSPSNGAILPPGDITFSWNSVSSATIYEFILYNSRGQIAGDAYTRGTFLTSALGTEETITWKVRAGDNSGNWGAWSSSWSLTLKSTTTISTESSPQISETTYFLKGSLHCPEKGGYPCDSCGPPPDYKNHFKGFNVLTTQEDCYVKLINQNGDYIGNQNNCEVIIKGEKWLGLENESGTKLVEEIDKGNFNFAPANKFVEKTMKIPEDGYYYEFANDGKEFRLYLSRDRVEAFNAVPWQNIIIETKNKETNKVFTYEFEKGIFPLAYSWNSGGVANYGQCVWWVAKRWAEEVDPMALFPFYPSSPEAVNVKIIDSNYQPKKYDILINYNPGGPPEHYGFVEKVEGDKVQITQFNWMKPGEVYNHVLRPWNGNATDLYYSINPNVKYYFKYYYRCMSTVEESGTYALRNIGPAGGYIFYDKGTYSDGWRYLEAAPASIEWTYKEWGSDRTFIGGTETGIGTGQSNTTIIVTWLNSHSETDRAAQVCDALTEGGYSDWFLPSKNELNLMYTNLKVFGVGDFAVYSYWSSSEYSADFAWTHSFTDGAQHGHFKNLTTWVRAVRAF